VKPYASYRRLLANARSALIAASEVYNKPAIEYRDEAFVILLINAWELLLKAILAKAKQDIFYPKKRNEPYKSLSVSDASARARSVLPKDLDPDAVADNVKHLVLFRDNAIHFYNQSDFRVLVYALGQTAVVNFSDVLEQLFGQRLEEHVSANLLPIGLRAPVDPIAFLAGTCANPTESSAEVCAFVSSLAESVQRLEKDGTDTGRLLTSYSVKLESTKKIAAADFVVGVGSGASGSSPLLVEVSKDPNLTHPFREKDILAKDLVVDGVRIGQRQFRAVVWKYGLRDDPKCCWQATEGILTRYSSEVLQFLRRLTAEDLSRAAVEYGRHMKDAKKKR